MLLEIILYHINEYLYEMPLSFFFQLERVPRERRERLPTRARARVGRAGDESRDARGVLSRSVALRPDDG